MGFDEGVFCDLKGIMSFKIDYLDRHFVLSSNHLPTDQRKYLLDYLAKVNHYKPVGFYQGSPVFSLYQPPLATPAGIRSIKIRLKRRFGSQRIPATATIGVTKACQCECVHCSAVFYNHHSKKELSITQLKEAILESVDLGVTNIILLGGEPLLRKGLTSLIESVPKNRAVVTLFTNGEYLSIDRCKKLAEAGLMGVFVSLDSADEKEHDQLRLRGGLFQKATQGIVNLKQEGILTAISSYLSPQRLAEGGFEEMMDLGKKLGVNEVTFFDAIPSGRLIKDESCLLRPEDRFKISQLVTKYRQKKEYPGLAVQSTMTCEGGSAFCFAANTQFYLTAFGEMCPCDFTPLTIGSYPKHSIKELWNKMIQTEPYNERAKSCRMQDPLFRQKFIKPIPQEGPYPFAI